MNWGNEAASYTFAKKLVDRDSSITYYAAAMQANAGGETHTDEDQGNLDVGTLQHYVKGTNFPAQKEEVASSAESNGAPQDLVTQISNANSERFNSNEEVMQALQGAEPVEGGYVEE